MRRRSADSTPMNALERRASAILAGIYAARMLGLFLVLPVFALAAQDLAGATPALIGLAIGMYGLTQALLQIPLGVLADRWGRVPVIQGGLIVFALGSVLAAVATDIWLLIAGRALQGAGAIAAAVMALAADLTRETQRTKAMAGIGLAIGASFAVALVAGPLLAGWIGLSGLFYVTAALALGAMTLLRFGLPEADRVQPVAAPAATAGVRPISTATLLHEPELLRLNAGVFLLHALLTASFLGLPHVLNERLHLPVAQHWQVYLPVFLLSVLAMAPLIVLAERSNRARGVFLGAIGALALAEALLAAGLLYGVALGAVLVLFFAAFNLLEATLPSWVSRLAPGAARGRAMGLFATSQFAGAFTGGALGGWLQGHHGLAGLFGFAAGMAALWLVLAWAVQPPRTLAQRALPLGPVDPARAREIAARLARIPGVAEVMVSAEEGMAYLTVDDRLLDPAALAPFRPAHG